MPQALQSFPQITRTLHCLGRSPGVDHVGTDQHRDWHTVPSDGDLLPSLDAIDHARQVGPGVTQGHGHRKKCTEMYTPVRKRWCAHRAEPRATGHRVLRYVRARSRRVRIAGRIPRSCPPARATTGSMAGQTGTYPTNRPWRDPPRLSFAGPPIRPYWLDRSTPATESRPTIRWPITVRPVIR
jgi:hypothetical protein